MKIAVIGATGNVGSELLRILAESKLSFSDVFPVASATDKRKVSFGDSIKSVKDIKDFNFSEADLVVFATNHDISEQYIPMALQAECMVIDGSSAFRMINGVPLIVPEVNGSIIENTSAKIIASPNCIATPLSMILHCLSKICDIKRATVSTYQSVSGAGKKAMDELYSQTKSKYGSFEKIEPKEFPVTIAFNCIPFIGSIDNGSYSSEEIKIITETNKILGLPIEINVTCVRIPVFVGHGFSLSVEFFKEVSSKEIIKNIKGYKGLHIADNNRQNCYATPLDCLGRPEVFISRIRNDLFNSSILNLWCVSDNLRKGAALNMAQLVECLAKRYFPATIDKTS